MSEYEATPSYIHLQRGRCCKSSCLHCPYGHTISTMGIQAQDVSADLLNQVQECLNLNKSSGVTAMLLAEAFKVEAAHTITSDNISLFKALYIKEHFFGCLYLNGDEKKLYLMPQFQDQNIRLEDVLIYIP